MGHYLSNVRDLEFNLFEVLGVGEILSGEDMAISTRMPPGRSSTRSAGWPRGPMPSHLPTRTAIHRFSTPSATR